MAPRAGKYKSFKNHTGTLTGTFNQLLEASTSTYKALFKDYDIYLKDNDEIFTLGEALNRYRYKRIFGEASYKQLKDVSKSRDPLRLAKSKKLIATYTGIDDDHNITFRITAEDPVDNAEHGRPTSYVTKVSLKDLAKLIQDRKDGTNDKTLVMSAIQGNIDVSCTCPAAKYWGQQYNGTKGDYSLDKNDIAPSRNIPTQPLCKHTILMLTVLPFWWNTIISDLRTKGILPSAKVTKDKTVNKIRANNIDTEIDDLEDIEVRR
jgi:hypothetical protein